MGRSVHERSVRVTCSRRFFVFLCFVSSICFCSLVTIHVFYVCGGGQVRLEQDFKSQYLRRYFVFPALTLCASCMRWRWACSSVVCVLFPDCDCVVYVFSRQATIAVILCILEWCCFCCQCVCANINSALICHGVLWLHSPSGIHAEHQLIITLPI